MSSCLAVLSSLGAQVDGKQQVLLILVRCRSAATMTLLARVLPNYRHQLVVVDNCTLTNSSSARPNHFNYAKRNWNDFRVETLFKFGLRDKTSVII